MRTVLQARHIDKNFGEKGHIYKALQDIHIDITEGEFIGVMGPSGAGKSTLLNIFSTIDKPSSGEIIIDDQNILSMKDEQLSDFRRNKLGFIFQDYNLLDPLTVKENIVLPLALSKVSISDIEQRVNDLGELFGITDILNKYPYHISGGQKQRTAAARAIASNPSLIFADEPTGALDSKSATSLLEVLSSLNKEHTATIMMVTHDAYAASFCTRVLFINDGRLFKEIFKGTRNRKEFFEEILEVIADLGGEDRDII
ncbi:ABC transporter ATP-binding protein [Bacillus sp. es.036]|uniref:ABC transporter ATP-binding protein n=1 Tax=Bacillus sp. es.036 TaxID=1761764 RepID=UPI000BF6A5C5|nr:ABC transporter ATP-binding protein [Bacillus sp. es.036]PFG14496.1 putative ABC transport system ATP-binding protein [Bacillus sp. es.036]